MLQRTISPGICNIPSRLPHLALSGRLHEKAGCRPGHIPRSHTLAWHWRRPQSLCWRTSHGIHERAVHSHQGKGRRDRDVPLTEKLLEALRSHWRLKNHRFTCSRVRILAAGNAPCHSLRRSSCAALCSMCRPEGFHAFATSDGWPTADTENCYLSAELKKFMTDSFVSVTLGAMPSFTNPNNWKFRSPLYPYC